ncbi:MAG TPA: hypothetical protein VH702_19630 [Vicinamibacterales bacterium]
MRVINELDRCRLVGLFWIYLGLLLVEGVLRKWLLPEWSDVLLIVRDPVALAIIGLGFRSGALTLGRPMRGLTALWVCFVALGALQIVFGDLGSVTVLGYGLRTYFLHPPLMFIMGRVFEPRDLRRATIAIVVLMLPIALLMVEQFRSAPSSWINRGAGEGRLQISSAMGRIRPAGPFSFISGSVLYYALAFACLLGSHFERDRVPTAVLWTGWAALILATAVSGSRALLFAFVPIGIAAGAAYLMRPQLSGAMVRTVGTAMFVVSIVWVSSVVQEGVEVFSARLRNSGGVTMLLERIRGTVDMSVSAWSSAPIMGAGLGLGTNAGTALLGSRVFKFGEDEWSRVVFEAGPPLGIAYLLWRAWLVWLLMKAAVGAARWGHVLPILCFGACAANLLSGQWGQTSIQGFAIWTAGMCIAGSRVAAVDVSRTLPVVLNKPRFA